MSYIKTTARPVHRTGQLTSYVMLYYNKLESYTY